MELARAADAAGTDEAIVTGEGLVRGRRVALVVSEFRFLAGSIGRGAAERIVRAFERAQRERIRSSPRRLRAGPGCRRARRPSSGW